MKRFTQIVTLILIAVFCTAVFAVTADDWPSKPVPKNTARITVVFSNDVHGGIMRSDAEFLNPEFPPTLGGASSQFRLVKAMKERAKRDGQHFMLVDAGDIYQGAPIGTVTKGQAIVDYYNLIGMDAVAVGNHDLDHGFWALDSMIKRSNFQWISANLHDRETNKQYPGTKQYLMKNFAGVKIAIIGLATTSTKFMSFPKNIANIEFLDEVPALEHAIMEAKADGAQAIWVVFHHGIQFDEEANYQRLLSIEQSGGFTKPYVGDAQELAQRVPGVDVMFCGHIHVGKPKGWVHPKHHTLLLQNYGHGGNIGAVDLFVDKTTGRLVDYAMPTDQSMLMLLQEEQWGRDPVIDKQIQAIVDTVERGMDEVIGESIADFIRGDGNAPMVSLVADAMRDYAQTDIGLQNSGGVRENVAPGYITRRQIFHIEPFGNELVSFKVKGTFLQKLLEGRASSTRLGMGLSGATVTFDGSKPQGERISKIEFHSGKVFHPDSMYSVSTSDYLLMGNSGMQILTEIPQDQVDWLGMRISDALVKYIEKSSPIAPSKKVRWMDTAGK
ncbi:MAG: 5'-nucleotidase C-terminal domain-containing protein [bacterium]|nr:5'-nucleotidase C-terminal domain-containing protein [bacterium]